LDYHKSVINNLFLYNLSKVKQVLESKYILLAKKIIYLKK
jgi:hypothetical protein